MSKLEEKAKEYAEGFRLKVDDGSWYQQKVQDFIAGYGEGFNDKKQLLIEFSDWLREDDMSKYSSEHLADWFLNIWFLKNENVVEKQAVEEREIEKINYVIGSFTDLKEGMTIMLLRSRETFTIDKVFDDGYVDMTATKQYNPQIGLTFHEKFYSIKLVNFGIIIGEKSGQEFNNSEIIEINK